MGLLTPEPSGIDLELCKLDEVVSLSQDYETDHLGGALWESELSHNVPTLEQLSRVREIVLGWARPTSERWERKVFVQSDQGEEECALSQALQRLIDPADQAFQINIYPDHPLVVKYGSPYTDAKVWVEAEHTRVILSQCCAWSGEYRADISNFFSYLRLFRSLATALGARGASFVDSRVLEPRLLDDLQTMWDLFRWGHGEHLEGAEIPRWVRDEFELAWTVAA